MNNNNPNGNDRRHNNSNGQRSQGHRGKGGGLEQCENKKSLIKHDDLRYTAKYWTASDQGDNTAKVVVGENAKTVNLCYWMRLRLEIGGDQGWFDVSVYNKWTDRHFK